MIITKNKYTIDCLNFILSPLSTLSVYHAITSLVLIQTHKVLEKFKDNNFSLYVV